jgi:glyoxylase-like metal-dependent hydrolase (beta-lactamase superfamily II)
MRHAAEGKITERITACGHPVYPGYVVRGNRGCMMIEAGLNILAPAYLNGLNGECTDGESSRLLLVTHGHYDHFGAATYLSRHMPSLGILGHALTERLLQKESVLETMNFLSRQTWAYFPDLIPELPDEDVIRIETVPFARTLADGDVVEIGDTHCVVYETPGHTKDHLSVFFPDEGILFPGEALGNAIRETEDEVKVEFLSSLADYFHSMEKLTALLPKVRVLALSHLFYYTGDDIPKFFDLAMNDTHRCREMIEMYLDVSHGDVEEAARAIVRVEYDEKQAVYQERNAYETNLRAQVRAVEASRG